MSLERVREWSEVAGAVYGSEDQAQLFYALIKMQRPATVLELGTALGVTTFWMAQAIKENGAGHVFTVDNGEAWQVAARLFERRGASPTTNEQAGPRRGVGAEAGRAFDAFLERLAARPVFHGAFLRDPTRFAERAADLHDHAEFLARMAELLEVRPHVSFLRGTMRTEDTLAATPERYPFLGPALERPIDLVFADCGHNTMQVLGLLAQLLPRLAPDGSIFIDSAATYLPAYLALEATIRALDGGKVPAFLLAGASERERAALCELAATRRFALTPIVERKGRSQNSLVWIRSQPVNVIPYPIASVRGMYDEHATGAHVSAETLEAYLASGRWSGPRISLLDLVSPT